MKNTQEQANTELLEKYLPSVIRYLSYRERCVLEVHRYLENKLECTPQDRDVILLYLQESRLVDDSRFCELRIHYRVTNGYGLFYIKQELFSLKISSQIISDELAEISDEQFIEGALKKAQSKLRVLVMKWEGDSLREKFIKYLYSRGYPRNLAEQIYIQITKEE